jgi:hypothetical protein
MSSYVPVALRRLVASRAGGICEYCLIHEDDTFFGCQVEHVISEKHGGETVAENLAYACVFCNQHKGSDIASLTDAGQLTRLFNPREERWGDHFAFETDGILIRAQTEIGAVTIKLLQFNHEDRIVEREVLRATGRYPSPQALTRIS